MYPKTTAFVVAGIDNTSNALFYRRPPGLRKCFTYLWIFRQRTTLSKL